MKKELKFAGNFLTSLNLFCGFTSILLSFEGKFNFAFYFIFLGLIFDMADGRIARALGISSKFGLEFDSLADLTTFGIAPSAMVYNMFLKEFEFGKIISFLPVLSVAIRLARFNVNSETKAKKYFEGLSSPLGAFLIISLSFIFKDIVILSEKITKIVFFLLIFSVSALQVSTIKFRSFKEVKMSKFIPYFIFLPPVLLWLLFFKQKIFFIISIFGITCYIIYSIIFENLRYGKSIYIRHDFERRRASAGLLNDNRREDQNGSGT